MLRNGLFLVAAEAARRAGEAGARGAERYTDALVLGSLREDVLAAPTGHFTEYPSFRHFGGQGLPGGYVPLLWPGPASTIAGFCERARRLASEGKAAAAFVQAGRAMHVLTDLSIPSHAHRAAHQRDPFEWYVEGNLGELRALPVPGVAPQRPVDLAASLARQAARRPPDRTQTPLGRRLHRLGLLRRVTAREAGEQARELIPLAIGHGAALLRAIGAPWGCASLGRMSERDDVLRETLEALEIPRRGLRAWFAHNRAFCMKHGGERVYGELLDLLRRCDEALDEREGRGP